MSAILSDAEERAAALWKMGKIRLFFVSFSSLIMSWLAATNQIDMSSLGWFDWFQTILGCLGNWSVLMAALLLTQGKAVAAGHVLGLEDVPDPDEHKEITTTTTTTIDTTKPDDPAQPKVNP